MARFSPHGNLRLSQSMPGSMDVTFAGCEASVAVSYANLGGDSFFVTALPKNTLTDAVIKDLNSYLVNTSDVIHSSIGRLGTYYVEKGANQRPSKVIYDRDNSTISLMKSDKYNWKNVLKNKSWLHVSGITPALSKKAYKATLCAVMKAKSLGLKTSCDLNFRSKLWAWDKKYNSQELARIKMPKILKYIDILIGNEQDAEDVLGIELSNTNFDKGNIDVNIYPNIAKKLYSKFTNLKLIAITLRESLSATHNRWGAMLYDCQNDNSYFSPTKNKNYSPFEIKNIVDRLGAGDSFAAGLIFSLNHLQLPYGESLEFAVASSCLAHSIEGDFNLTSQDEVLKLMKGFSSGRVIR